MSFEAPAGRCWEGASTARAGGGREAGRLFGAAVHPRLPLAAAMRAAVVGPPSLHSRRQPQAMAWVASSEGMSTIAPAAASGRPGAAGGRHRRPAAGPSLKRGTPAHKVQPFPITSFIWSRIAPHLVAG